MGSKFIYHALPIGKGQLVLQAVGVAADVAFLAPLSTHLAAQVAVIGDRKRNRVRKFHEIFLLNDSGYAQVVFQS